MAEPERYYSTSQSLTITSIQADLDTLQDFSKSRCIYKVPRSLRQVNNDAYTPMIVSIGPIYYLDERFFPMKLHKLKYLQSFLNDCRFNVNLNSCLKVVEDNEAKIRESYADSTMHISSDEFTRMIFVDSVFVIELLRRFFDHSLIKDDHIYGSPRMITEVLRDIKLAENQLPFFILKDIYWVAFKPHEDNNVLPYFTELECTFLNVDIGKIHIDNTTKEASCLHFMDLMRSSFLPSKDAIDVHGWNMVCPTTKNLYEAGIKFQVDKSHDSSWTDVHFDPNKGILTITRLLVGDGTESFLRDLIAFEQCHYWNQVYISDYLFFLDCLINTPDDMKVLAKAGIIENWLGSDQEASDLINSLGKNVVVSLPNKYHYAVISEKLNSHCTRRWNRYRTTLNHTYFKHPWAVISVIYAVVLLILTVIQVLEGIISVPFASKKC